jgi:hypothetical protein
MSDPINPKHYKHLPAEAIDIIDAAIEGAPSPQAAAAQSHLLGYALRANQKGQLAIDAGKAEWYAARWLKAIREAEAKASGANETPIGEPDQDDRPHDFKVGDAVISWHGQEGVIEAINLIDDFPITVRHSIREQVSYKLGGVKKKHDEPPPKRYREPTQADLRNGPVCCEVRDWDSEQWKVRQLIQIHKSHPFRFVCKNETCDNPLNWNQCRIEVTE